jgi:hypothetical protein
MSGLLDRGAPGGEPPRRGPRGVLEILQIFAGLLLPPLLLLMGLSLVGSFRFRAGPAFAALVALELILAVSAVGLLARRRAPWFAVPCALVGSALILLLATCWGITRLHF